MNVQEIQFKAHICREGDGEEMQHGSVGETQPTPLEADRCSQGRWMPLLGQLHAHLSWHCLAVCAITSSAKLVSKTTKYSKYLKSGKHNQEGKLLILVSFIYYCFMIQFNRHSSLPSPILVSCHHFPSISKESTFRISAASLKCLNKQGKC